MENEKIINDLCKEIENTDNKKETLIDELLKNQNIIMGMTNKRNTIMLMYIFALVLLSLGITVFTSFAFALGSFIIGGALGVGIKDLIKLKEKPFKDKIIIAKEDIELVKEEKSKLKNELAKYITKENKEDLIDSIDKRLNEIRQEKNELNKLKDLMDNEAKLIDITTVYIVEIDNIKHLAYLEMPMAKACRFKDIFSNEDVWRGLGSNLDEALDRSHSKPTSVARLKEVEPTVLAYPNNLVPDYVLKQIYYSLNNVDLNNPILKKEKN